MPFTAGFWCCVVKGPVGAQHAAIKSEELCLIICLDDDNLVRPYDGQLLLMTAMSTMIKMIKERDFCFCLFTYVSAIASFCLFLSFFYNKPFYLISLNGFIVYVILDMLLKMYFWFCDKGDKLKMRSQITLMSILNKVIYKRPISSSKTTVAETK